MATHSSILAWRIPWTEEPGGLQSWGHKESDATEHICSFIIHSFVHSFILPGPTFLHSHSAPLQRTTWMILMGHFPFL